MLLWNGFAAGDRGHGSEGLGEEQFKDSESEYHTRQPTGISPALDAYQWGPVYLLFPPNRRDRALKYPWRR